MPYHHGDLRRALLDAAADDIVASGVAAMSLRRVAGLAGVSHAAVAHHFGDKRGLLTALAVEGYGLLGDAMAAASADRRDGDLLAFAIGYVRFAADHPAHFGVMFLPDVLDEASSELVAARARTREMLASATGSADRAVAAWALVHGLATLYLSGNLTVHTTEGLVRLTRRAAGSLTTLGG